MSKLINKNGNNIFIEVFRTYLRVSYNIFILNPPSPSKKLKMKKEFGNEDKLKLKEDNNIAFDDNEDDDSEEEE